MEKSSTTLSSSHCHINFSLSFALIVGAINFSGHIHNYQNFILKLPVSHRLSIPAHTHQMLRIIWHKRYSMIQSLLSTIKYIQVGGPSRWWRSKMWRSPSSLQIHQKCIYMWNTSYRTPTECWQKTSDFPKGKKIHTYLGRAKEKRKNRDKRIGTGPAPLGGSCEGGKVFTH